MDLFHAIEDGQAIICSKGVYRQVKVFRRGNDVYAGCGTGFIKLYGAAGTSAPRISWQGIEGIGVVCEAGKQPKFDPKLVIEHEVQKVVDGREDGRVIIHKTKRRKNGDTIRKPRSSKKHIGLAKQVS